MKTNCVNCGAILKSNKCEYCGTENGVKINASNPCVISLDEHYSKIFEKGGEVSEITRNKTNVKEFIKGIIAIGFGIIIGLFLYDYLKKYLIPKNKPII